MRLTEKNSPYFYKELDILFVALNPPVQSNRNGHYFSGERSLFFPRLYDAGLITFNLDKKNADEIVFGTQKFNYKNKKYGVVDMLPYREETNSKQVKVTDDDYYNLIDKLIFSDSKNIVLIHSKVSEKFEKIEEIELIYGNNGPVLEYLDIKANIFKMPFPNGSNYKKRKS
ncbi:uracil-DNA glycosylase family protein [Enterococcus alcedinis]|uniref:Uracil-DNA glycosylase-like domain-containing protein n=1 Tax=Enterococcus alcedinis TaxID=1274384 RepID=A0A917JGY1_9ENTE|nr:uracil-DNA glycosylase family protein [Enterococcus alcedinis]MBP2102062.1 hypothetical protein [Enterococcus alcedinis]GGI65625.1 hypothetical protein GCM10011482_12790 [Enterococcus alcedinis]